MSLPFGLRLFARRQEVSLLAGLEALRQLVSSYLDWPALLILFLDLLDIAD